MAAALRRGAGRPAERDIYASYVNEAFLDGAGKARRPKIVFQFSLGAEPLPYETGSRVVATDHRADWRR